MRLRHSPQSESRVSSDDGIQFRVPTLTMELLWVDFDCLIHRLETALVTRVLELPSVFLKILGMRCSKTTLHFPLKENAFSLRKIRIFILSCPAHHGSRYHGRHHSCKIREIICSVSLDRPLRQIYAPSDRNSNFLLFSVKEATDGGESPNPFANLSKSANELLSG